MRNHLFNIALTLLAVITLTSCHDDDLPSFNPEPNSPIRLSEQEVEIGSDGRYYSVTASVEKQTGDVRATTDAKWIELDADSLSAYGKLRFYVQPNEDYASRDATITFRLGQTTERAILKIHQRSLADDDANAVPGGALTRISRVGYGYNMFIDYIDPKSVTEPILDYQKMVEAEQTWGTIIAQEGRSQQDLSIRSSYSIEEMTAWLTEQVTTEVNILFYNKKVTKFKRVDEYDKTQSSFGFSSLSKTVASRYVDEGKLESIIRSGKDIFTTDFRKQYDMVNSQPSQQNIENLINKFGTHLVVYADLGGRLDYMVNFRSQETSRETIEKYMKYKNGKQKENRETEEASHNVYSNGSLSYDIYGGSEEAIRNLTSNPRTSDIYNQIDPSLLNGWLQSIRADDNKSLSMVHCLLLPIWQLFTNPTARSEIISYILVLARQEGGTLGARLEELSLDNYYRLDITKEMEKWGNGTDNTLVKLVYLNNMPKMEICNEYVPELRGDRRVTIFYPIYRNVTNIRRGFFRGDGENPPAEVMFDNEGGCYVRPLSDFKAGDIISTIYYIDGAYYATDMGIRMPEVKASLRDYKIDLKDGYTYPVVKIGPGYWTRQNIKGQLQFGAPVDPSDPDCYDYDMYEEVRNGMLYANIFYGNSLSYRTNYPGLFDPEVDEMDNRIHWYVPRVKDIRVLETYVGKNCKSLFPNQQSGFDAQFAGYNGEFDDLNQGKQFEKMGMHYVGEYCFIASKEGVSNSGEALVLSPDYTLKRCAINKATDNWYPLRAFRSSYYKYQ